MVELAAAELGAADHALLSEWFAATVAKAPRDFAHTVVAAAQHQLGKPYALTPDEPSVDEPLRVSLATFECVSFVESALSVARCLTLGQPDAACFLRELIGLRYRDGRQGDYASRLHYFTDWISDNARRQHLDDVTQTLGGKQRRFHFSYMTHHWDDYGPMVHEPVRDAIRAVEAALSAQPVWTLGRAAIARAQRDIQDGDIVAFATDKPGLLISHAGLVVRGPRGTPRVLHASSAHGRVVLTPTDLADYVLRRPERQGIVVARPRVPGAGGQD